MSSDALATKYLVSEFPDPDILNRARTHLVLARPCWVSGVLEVKNRTSTGVRVMAG